jgi:hypothetical protein
MKPLTLENLRSLCAPTGAACVSIYLPFRLGPGTENENRLHFKNLLKRVASELEPRLAHAERTALLGHLNALAATDPWNHGSRGMAAFATVRGEQHYLLTQAPAELTLVADSFHLRPLLKLFESNRRYYLLTLSTRRARLFRGTSEGLVATDLPGLANAISAAVPAREHQASTGVRNAGRTTVHYGHSPQDAQEAADLVHFLKAVDQALLDALRDEKAPLVLAAAPDQVAEWHRVCRYPHLLERGLSGHFDDVSSQELHAKAWPIVAEQAKELERHAIENYGTQLAHGRASAELSTIARAAVQGRVREILLADGEHLPGWIDRDTGEVRTAKPGDRADDVYDDIAEAVLLRGGEVHALPKAEMPQKVPIAALFRW